jgi:PAS domain S-box-containing protein
LLGVLDHSSDVLFITDTDDRLLYISRSVLALTGMAPEDLIGKPLITVVKQSDHGASLDALEAARTDEDARSQVLEMPWRTGGAGEAATMEVVLRGIWTEGEARGCVGVARDLSKRRQYLDDRLTSERLAAIVELAVAAAHKINNPLAILSVQVGVMERQIDEGQPVPRETLEQMRQVIARISEVVRDLAAIADTSVHRRVLGRAMVDLGGWADLAEKADDDM